MNYINKLKANSMDLNLNNKTALITGASKGIGKAIAQSMAEEGCNLVITARSEDKLKAVSYTHLTLPTKA